MNIVSLKHLRDGFVFFVFAALFLGVHVGTAHAIVNRVADIYLTDGSGNSVDGGTIQQGTSIKITWDHGTLGTATGCTGTNFSTGGATSGSVIVTPPLGTTTYSVTCTYTVGSPASASSSVMVQSVAIPTATLSSNPTSIVAGYASVLSYQCTNSTSGSITNYGPINANGAVNTISVSPSSTTTYTLSCTGPGGAANASEQVNVTQPSPMLTGSCSVFPQSIVVGGTATWTGTPAGGTGPYTYTWGGTDGLTGMTGATANVAYPIVGTKYGTLFIKDSTTAAATPYTSTETVSKICTGSLVTGAGSNTTEDNAVISHGDAQLWLDAAPNTNPPSDFPSNTNYCVGVELDQGACNGSGCVPNTQIHVRWYSGTGTRDTVASDYPSPGGYTSPPQKWYGTQTFSPGSSGGTHPQTASITCSNSLVVNPPAPTASASVSPNPVPYGSAPAVTLSSTNGNYCYVRVDNADIGPSPGYFSSGTWSASSSLSPGTHETEVYCYNSVWVGSGWQYGYFTVSPPPNTSVSASPNPVPNGAAPTINTSSPNGAYCAVRIDWNTIGVTDWSFAPGTPITGPANLSAGTHEAEVLCYNSAWTSYGNGWGTSTFTVSGPPTTSASISPNPTPYGSTPAITLSSTNANYCYVRLDWGDVTPAPDTGYFTSGTFYGPTTLGAGSHEVETYCYNSVWVGSGWVGTPFTVSSPPQTSVSVSPNTVPYGGTPAITLSSTNANYCYVLVDSNWSPYILADYVTSGTFSGPNNLTPGSHYAMSYCYNSVWVGSGWSYNYFTVSPPPPNPVGGSVTPASVTAGTSVVLAGAVSNTGTGSTVTSFPSWFIVRNAANGGGSDVWDNNISAPALAAGASETIQDPAFSFPSAGTYSAIVCAGYDAAWNRVPSNSSGGGCGPWTNITVAVLVPTATLTATPSSIGIGDSSTLAWTSNNAFSCTGTGFSTGGATSGSITVSPGSATTYSLTCTSASNGTVTKNASVGVTYPDLTPSGGTSFSTNSPTPGTSVTLSAAAANTGAATARNFPNMFQIASDAAFSNTVALVNASGVASLAVNAAPAAISTAYTFSTPGTYYVRSCVNYNNAWAGSITETNTGNNCGAASIISVSYPGLSGSCSVSPAGGSPGDTFTWKTNGVSGGTGSYAYSWSGTDGLAGATSVVTKSYVTTGTKSGAVTITSGSQTLPLTCPSIAISYPPGVILTATPPEILKGATSTLSWVSQNTTSCTGTGFSTGGQANGSYDVGPLTTTTYSISCTNPSSAIVGQSTASVTVTVADLGLTATPSFVRPGDSTTLSWTVNGSVASCALSGPAGQIASCSGAACATGSTAPITISKQSVFTLSCNAGTLHPSVSTVVNLTPKFIEF